MTTKIPPIREITIERVPHNGHLICSTIHKGYLVKHAYIGYTKQEALQMFREYLKSL